jgi:hypothetical protein
MLELYKGFVENYGVITIEDPYEQDDWDNWKAITTELGVRRAALGMGERVRPQAARPPTSRVLRAAATPKPHPSSLASRASSASPLPPPRPSARSWVTTSW